VIATNITDVRWTAEPARGPRELWFRITADIAAFTVWLRRASCGLGGHTMVMHFEPQRVALECVGCGKQTPGWTLDRQ
jgi:hypothetical protein